MFKSYFKIAWRNFIKDKVFSLISVSGLSLGITCSILIGLWVLDEYQKDAFHENIDRIFVVTSREFSGSEIYGSYDTPGLLADELEKVLPEVEYSSNYAWNSFHTFSAGDKKMKLEGNFAGSNFFRIFSYPLLLGSKETALQSPESIAISEKMATNLFGSPELAIGQTVRFENYRDLKVTAVFENLKDNTSFRFEYLINWDFFIERNKWVNDWNNSGPTTFVKLYGQVNPETVKSKIQHFIKDYDKQYSDIERLELGLQPFREMYLHSNFENGVISGGRIQYVKLFSLVAIFILLIACINFMNLSTARSVKRAKEVGVRKVIGAGKTDLKSQFMLEALLVTILAVLSSLLLLIVILPQFSLLTGKNLESPLLAGEFWLGIGILLLVTTLISGSYPAFLLSSFKPIAALKSNLRVNSSSVSFRKLLVVFQFSLSVIFIIGMIVISKQVDYFHNKNLGYQKDNLIYLPLAGNIAVNYDVFKSEALKIQGIKNISLMSQRPVELENSTGSVEWKGKEPGSRPTFTEAAVGYDFIKTMEATLLHGRDFSHDFADSANYIINEKALEIIGYKDPIGMPLSFWGQKGTIIGVVKDFHFNSLHVPINPLVLRLVKGRAYGYALLRTDPESVSASLAELEKLHQQLNPDFPFAYQFADEEYALMYKSEQVVKQLSGYFAVLAIFISCIGLLGLAIFTAEQRRKEVGIRKVLGARVSQIVSLLSIDFIKLVVLANIIALPFAYYLTSEWLHGFEYRISINWWIFIVAPLATFLISTLTVSIQFLRTAIANPINSLRSE